MKPTRLLFSLLLAGLTIATCQAERFNVTLKVTCNEQGEGAIIKETLNNQKVLTDTAEDNELTVAQLAVILDTEQGALLVVRRDNGATVNTIFTFQDLNNVSSPTVDISHSLLYQGETLVGSAVAITKNSGNIPKINASFNFSHAAGDGDPAEVCTGTIVSTSLFRPTNNVQ
jgi:hypothetical protein